MEKKTHWREVHSTDHIGSHDLIALGVKELVVQIKSASRKEINANGKKDTTIVAELVGQKPMIVNVTNSESIEAVCGSGFLSDWAGVFITIYNQDGVRNPKGGSTVTAIRVKKFAPKVETPKEVLAEIEDLKLTENLEDLKTFYTGSKYRNHIEMSKAKDKHKIKLENDAK